MSKVKYRVREFSPKANQGGTHSFFAEAVISTDIVAEEPETPSGGGDNNGGNNNPPSGELEG